MHKYCYSNFGAIFAKGLFHLLVFNPSLISPTNILASKLDNTMGSVNRILHGRAEIRNLSSSVQHRKRNFVSPRGRVIFFLLYKHQ